MSSENLSSLDPSSPLYVYRKALKNHEQQRQEEEEKERSYTLPLKGGARRRSLPPQQLPQTMAPRPRINNAPGNAPSTRMYPTAQNDNRKFGPLPVQQQQQPVQYQHKSESYSLQSQPPWRTNATTNNNYMKTNVNPNYRPYVLNIGGRPIPSVEQNGVHMNRRPNFQQAPIVEDWQYYQSTRISYDKNSDTTFIRSLV